MSNPTDADIFAKVAVGAHIARPSLGADKTFDYAIPLGMSVQAGHRVLVPFGRRNLEGYVVALKDYTDVEPSKIKEITEVLETFPIFSPVMLNLASWMSQKYSTPLAACLRAIMPAGIGLKNDYVASVCIQSSDSGSAAGVIPKGGLRGKQKQIFEYVALHGKVSQRELSEVFGKTMQTALKALCDKGLLVLHHIYEVKDFTLRINIAHINDDNPDFEDLRAVVAEKGGPQAGVLELLMNNHSMPVADIGHLLEISPSPVKSLEQKGLLRIELTEIRREVVGAAALGHPHKDLNLTDEQTLALNALKSVLEANEVNEKNEANETNQANETNEAGALKRQPILIQGVTGSGKTEIYIRIIQEVLNQGKQAIVLVPEISLTPQTIAAFAARFGPLVTATHSRLSLGERYDQWKKAKDGRVSVIIGPRSAIFTPFENLGIIIIDEEHENTYKSGNAPKYDTLAVAEKLCELTGAMLVLGSATPNVSTYYKAENSRQLIELKHRVNHREIHIEIADMRKELAEGNKTIFSEALYAGLKDVLKHGKQAILFINRRGHSTFVSCRSCGYVAACANCSVNYTYHIFSGKLICHYCAATAKSPKNCPTCGSVYIKYFGIGTQKVEEFLAQEFPETKVLRMDMDTTSRKNSHHRIIGDFAEGKAQILVGTQMIAKGLNFPKVALVGIVAADLALHTGDFRAAETTYQLITQVSGRAGRGDEAGKVIIQTYNPDHYSIKYAARDDFKAFYKHEIEIRKQMNYPPFTHIFQIMFLGENEKHIIKTLHVLLAIMNKANKKGLCEVLGPAPAIVSKIKQNYRWKILVKCADEDILKQFVYYCLDILEKNQDMGGIKTNLTPNPAYIQ